MRNKIFFFVKAVISAALVFFNASCLPWGNAHVVDSSRRGGAARGVSVKAPLAPEVTPAQFEAEADAQVVPDSADGLAESAPLSAREPSAKPDGGDTLSASSADRGAVRQYSQVVSDIGALRAVAISGSDALNAPPAGGDGAQAAPDQPEAPPLGDFRDKSIGADMVFVKGGTFTMGCTVEQGEHCYEHEKPTRNVTLSDFYIGRHEVTQKQWMALMGDNPSLWKGDSLPVENVRWDDVKTFIEKLNAMTETGMEYRLPTEAEWEYAARGGAVSGSHVYSGSSGVGDVAWYEDNGGNKTSPVGSKVPNELGVYDMSGNVWELVGDWFGDYDAAPRSNPSGPPWGSYHVMRGGSWSSGVRACRVTHRMSLAQGFSSGDVGFRLAIGTRETVPTIPVSQLMRKQAAAKSGSGVAPAKSGSVEAPAKTGGGGLPAKTVSGRVKAAPAPVADTSSGEALATGEGSRVKLDKGISVGIGGFYGGDYGGGIAWANGEELAMPYGGVGTYLFVDAFYAEAFVGYSGGGGKWKSPDAKIPNSLPEMSRSYLNVGVLLKYPVGGGSFFPLIGLDYEASMSGKLKYQNGNVYEFDIKNWRHDASALSALWLKLGCGINIDLAGNTYLRGEAMYGFRTANTFEKYDARLSNHAETRPGYGLTCRVGVGFKLAE